MVNKVGKLLSKLYFCGHKSPPWICPQKSSCLQKQGNNTRNSYYYIWDNMDKRNIVRKVRLSPEEDTFFKEKAANYPTISGMIRDAVRQFNDIGTIRKIEALTEMAALYRKYQQDLAWLGGNFNQAMKRANELAIGGELTQSYYVNVIMPQLTHLLDFLEKVKDEQHKIFTKLTRR